MKNEDIAETFTWKDACSVLLEQQAKLDEEKINDGPVYNNKDRLKAGEIDGSDG